MDFAEGQVKEGQSSSSWSTVWGTWKMGAGLRVSGLFCLFYCG